MAKRTLLIKTKFKYYFSLLKVFKPNLMRILCFSYFFYKKNNLINYKYSYNLFLVLFYQLVLFTYMILETFSIFLYTYELFLTLRIILEWFPALNPFDYKCLISIIEITNPFVIFIEQNIPRIGSYSIASYFCFIIINLFIYSMEILIDCLPYITLPYYFNNRFIFK
jgi:hypothetical protein